MAFFEQAYCIDYNGWVSGASTAPPPKQIDFASQTIPELVYTRANSDRVAVVFDAEKVSYTFAKVVTEMETLAAGFLSIGLKHGDRILICGSNHSQVFALYKSTYYLYSFGNFSVGNEGERLAFVDKLGL